MLCDDQMNGGCLVVKEPGQLNSAVIQPGVWCTSAEDWQSQGGGRHGVPAATLKAGKQRFGLIIKAWKRFDPVTWILNLLPVRFPVQDPVSNWVDNCVLTVKDSRFSSSPADLHASLTCRLRTTWQPHNASSDTHHLLCWDGWRAC